MKPLPTSLLATLYCGYVLPIFDYCDTVWSPSTTVLSKSLERIHSRFVNSLSRADTFVRLTLAERRQFHTAVAVFKSINKLGPVYMNDLFTSSVTLTGFSGRNQHRLYISGIRYSYGRSSFYYRGAVLWNQLNPRLYGTYDLFNFKIII